MRESRLVDYSGPVLRLANLSPEDLFVLLGKIRHVFAGGDVARYLIPDEGIQAFMAHCAGRVGEAYFRTPRNSITAFVNLLAVLEQNPGVSWRELLGRVEIDVEANPDLAPLPEASTDVGGHSGVAAQEPTGADDDDLSTFRL